MEEAGPLPSTVAPNSPDSTCRPFTELPGNWIDCDDAQRYTQVLHGPFHHNDSGARQQLAKKCLFAVDVEPDSSCSSNDEHVYLNVAPSSEGVRPSTAGLSGRPYGSAPAEGASRLLQQCPSATSSGVEPSGFILVRNKNRKYLQRQPQNEPPNVSLEEQNDDCPEFSTRCLFPLLVAFIILYAAVVIISNLVQV